MWNCLIKALIGHGLAKATANQGQITRATKHSYQKELIGWVLRATGARNTKMTNQSVRWPRPRNIQIKNKSSKWFRALCSMEQKRTEQNRTWLFYKLDYYGKEPNRMVIFGTEYVWNGTERNRTQRSGTEQTREKVKARAPG